MARNWIAASLLGTSLIMGCSGKSNRISEQKAFEMETSKAKAVLKAKMYAEILRANLSEVEKKRFLKKSFLYLFQGNEFVIKESQIQPDLEDFLKLDPSRLVLRGNHSWHPIVQRADWFDDAKVILNQMNGTLEEGPLDGIAASDFIVRLRWVQDVKGRDVAKAFLEKTLNHWYQDIVEKNYLNAQENYEAFLRYQSNFQFASFEAPSIDSSLEVMASFLPESTETLKTVKRLLVGTEIVTGEEPIPVTRIVQSAVLKDIDSARKQSRSSAHSSPVFDRVDAGIDLGAKILDYSKVDSKKVQDFTKYAHAAVSVSRIASGFDFSKFGLNLATGNMLGAVSDVVGGLFGFGNSASEPQVMNMLSGIRSDLADFRQEAVQRMNVMNQKLDLVLLGTKREIELLESGRKTLNEVQDQLFELSSKLDNMAWMINQGYGELYLAELNKLHRRCFDSSVSMASASYDSVRSLMKECADGFATHALQTSMLKTRSGELDSNVQMPSSITEFALMDRGLQVMGVRARLPKLNFSDFVIGVDDYLNLLVTNSKYIRHEDRDNIRFTLADMEKTGLSIQSSLNDLSDEESMKSVIDHYRDSVELFLAQKGDETKSLSERMNQIQTKFSYLVRIFKLVDVSRLYRNDRFAETLSEDGLDHVKVSELIEIKVGRNSDKIHSLQEKLSNEFDVLNDYVGEVIRLRNAAQGNRTLVDLTLRRIQLMKSAF